MDSLMKFPSTPHLAILDSATVRDDKVLTSVERDRFLTHNVTIEEKVDGANLGFSIDRTGAILAQNRGTILRPPMTGQWRTLPDWLAIHNERLFDVLTDRFILFGEWCYARHSIAYDRLPDWFIGFDVFDIQAKRFVCQSSRDRLFSRLKLHVVPCLATGRFTLSEVRTFLDRSRFGASPAEGLYLRHDDGDWLGRRAKLVRPDFIQGIGEHWSRRPLDFNRLMDPMET